jgi:transcriptional pleiotropic regulator of transition state genes
MHKRKITKEGRVNIPAEILHLFRLKEEDEVVISHNKSSIIIKPFVDQGRCAITGKPSSNLTKIGESYISKEGLKLIADKMK